MFSVFALNQMRFKATWFLLHHMDYKLRLDYKFGMHTVPTNPAVRATHTKEGHKSQCEEVMRGDVSG